MKVSKSNQPEEPELPPIKKTIVKSSKSSKLQKTTKKVSQNGKPTQYSAEYKSSVKMSIDPEENSVITPAEYDAHFDRLQMLAFQIMTNLQDLIQEVNRLPETEIRGILDVNFSQDETNEFSLWSREWKQNSTDPVVDANESQRVLKLLYVLAKQNARKTGALHEASSSASLLTALMSHQNVELNNEKGEEPFEEPI